MKEHNANDLLTSEDDSDVLGKGSYASVRRCHHKKLGNVVVKCFSLDGSKSAIYRKYDCVEKEAKTLFHLQHNNIIKVYGVTKWRTCFGIVMEEATGYNMEDLFLHELTKDIPWRLRLKFLNEIANGLEYLHYHDKKRAYIHGDLKLQNILLNDNLVVKIADFGAVSLVQATGAHTSSSGNVSSNQHTWLYSPPEVLIEPTMKRTREIDVYSYAMIGYEIITRQQVFVSSGHARLNLIQQLIKDGEVKPDPQLIADVKKSLVNEDDLNICRVVESIVIECWQTNPKSRPSIKAVRNKLEAIDQLMIQKPNKTGHLIKEKTFNTSNKVSLNRFEFPFHISIQNGDASTPANDIAVQMNNIDSENRQLFQDVGLTETDLQDERTAAFVYDFKKEGEASVQKTDNSSTFNSNVQNPSNEFADAGSTNNHDQYGITCSGSIIAMQQMQGDSNARSPPTVSHEFGNDSKMPNTSSFTSSVSSADSIENNSPTFPQTRLILPTSHQFIFTPADFSVARFIKYSRKHTQHLKDAFSSLANAEVFEQKSVKKVEYRFRPVQNCELSEEEFRLKCQSTLKDFLDLYSSANKFFNHEHLMNAMTKDPEFFKKQSSHERELLYVDWHIDRNKVLLTGLICDVHSKIEEITTHLDALVPKTLKELYEFDMDPPSLILARFIKENNFHLNSLRGSLENARLWITPGSLKLHFKATIQLEQHSIPKFEDECKSIATKFFRKFSVWKPRYPIPVVKATVRSNPELFGFHVTNCMCEVSDQNEIILVGLRPVASKKQSEIQKALDKNDAIIIKAKKKTRGRKRSPSVEPVADDAFADHADKLRPFLYEPKAKANLNVLKHVFQNPLAVNDLQLKVGLLIGFEPFPNPIEPLGLRFFPTLGPGIDVEYYTKDMPASVAEFFGRFLLCRSRCEPHQEKNILDAVYFCGQKYNVPERGISIHKENGFVNVVGPRRVIAELVKMVDGIKCEGIGVHLHQLPGSSRKLSTSSNKSQPASNKNKKTPNKSSSVAPKPQNEKLNTIVYNPKKQYVPQFKFTWDNHRFREELKSRFSDFCDLDGTNEKLQIVQKTEEVDRSTFPKVVVQKMEEFFDSISIDLLSLDSDVMQYFKENEEDWLKNHYDPKDWILISWKENGIEMKGFKNDVLKYKSIIESQLEDTETVIKATSEITNVLNVCGVIAETNRQLGGKVVISCTPGADTVSFKGRRCFHESAQAKLAEMGQLVEKAPITSPQKLKVLASIKEKNGKGIQLIEKKMAEKNIKCVLLLQSGKVILTAMTEEMFSKGSKFLDQLIRSVDTPKPDGIPANTFKGKAWNNLVSKLTASNTVFVSLQNSYITLSAFDQDTLSDAAAEVKKFLDALLVKTREIQCQGHVTRFVMTFHARKGLTLTQTKSGLQIDGSAKDVDKFVESLRGITWSRCQITYTAPELASYFNSSNWKNFVKILEQEIRCTIYCDLSKCKHQSDGEEEVINSPSTSQSRDNFDINNVQVASYGGVMVSVRHGDICDDNSDAIVNGVISTDFNLARGAVSSSLLRRAGRNLQHECDAADKSSPVIRHTRGCKLRCSHVIHVVTPNQPDVLTQRLKDVLDHAELLRAKSVALPTLGAGGIGLQSSDVASSMSKAFELFAHSKPRFVRNIKVVVYDLPIVTMFQTTIVQSKKLMDFRKRAIEASESKYKSLLDDEVSVHINCDDSTYMQQAKTRIEQLMSSIIISKTIKVESFSGLDDHDRSDIYEAAVKHKARVVFNSLKVE